MNEEGWVVSGDATILRRPLVGLVGSVRVPPDLVLPALDLARGARAAEVPLVAGFQTPLEREWLRVALRGNQHLVIVLARRIEHFRAPRLWTAAIDAGRILIVSNPELGRRVTAQSAEVRNRAIVTLASCLFVVHAQPGSRAFRAAQVAVDRRRELYCFAHPRNLDLQILGAQPVPRYGWQIGRESRLASGWSDPHRADSVQNHDKTGAHVGDHRHPEGR